MADLKVDGTFLAGEAEQGWEVFELDMVVAHRPRADGRLVYFVDLPSATISFASEAGALFEC